MHQGCGRANLWTSGSLGSNPVLLLIASVILGKEENQVASDTGRRAGHGDLSPQPRET